LAFIGTGTKRSVTKAGAAGDGSPTPDRSHYEYDRP
jgi:hypothetical protein